MNEDSFIKLMIKSDMHSVKDNNAKNMLFFVIIC